MSKRGEYEIIYDFEDDDSRNYEELDENRSVDELVEVVRNTFGRGDCIYCGAKDAMEYVGGICFVCSECNKAVHEDIYYRWVIGFPVEFED